MRKSVLSSSPVSISHWISQRVQPDSEGSMRIQRDDAASRLNISCHSASSAAMRPAHTCSPGRPRATSGHSGSKALASVVSNSTSSSRSYQVGRNGSHRRRGFLTVIRPVVEKGLRNSAK